MTKGTTFWRKDEDSDYTHLRFIISNPDVDNKVLVVGMSRFKNNKREDTSCLLHSGEHECIKVESKIRYDKALEIVYSSLLQEKFKGIIELKASISSVLLARIQSGAKTTKALAPKFKKYFQYF